MTPETDQGSTTLPNAPGIEKSVLGLACDNPGEVIGKLQAAGGGADSFYIPAHRTIWQHVCRLHDDGRAVVSTLLFQSLDDSGELESVGGQAGFADITSAVCSPSVLDEYIKELITKQEARRIHMSILSLNAKRKEGASSEELAAMLQTASESAAESTGERCRVYNMKDIMHGIVSRLEEQMKLGSHIEGVRTGFTALDDMLGGMRAGGGYYLIAARPGEGKTAIALNIARAVAAQSEAPGGRVLFVSAEMSPDALVRRLLCAEVGQSWRAMCETGLNEYNEVKIHKALKKLKYLQLEIYEPRGSVEECAAVVKNKARGGGLSLVVVDYAQLFHSEKAKDGTRVDELERVSDTFRNLAKALPCPLLLLAQVNRAADKSADRRPGMADVKGSGAFEQDAEAVILLHRPEAHAANDEARAAARGKAELIVCKNRNGETGIIQLEWSGATQSFHNAAEQDE